MAGLRRFLSTTRAPTQLEHLRYATDPCGLRILLDCQQGKKNNGYKDVFLSHSGKQKNFVRQLFRDLTRQHVSCFFDEDEKSLPLAEEFTSRIFEAAETCKIAVLVISKDFIRSKWPMIELAAFIRARNTGTNANLSLLPIFFMIRPKELSHITKDWQEWKDLEESDVRRGEWQDALKAVRSMKGLQFSEDGDEVVCRDRVVNKICCLLKSPLQLLDFEPVGIEEQVREVKAMLDMEGTESALAVIVYGFGGLGKSTLAACVVQSLDRSSTDFKFCRVEIDEKTQDKTSHIIQLQKNILYDLGGGEAYLRNPLDGRCKIKEALTKKHSLLFIDNVVDKDYVRDLLPKDLPLGEQDTKLRIIITSREKNVRAELEIMCKEYEVKCLCYEASKGLLSKPILQSQVEKQNDLDEEHMINEVAAACRGVPLLLSVFGKHLRLERNRNSYQEALDVLREGNLDSYRDEDLGTKLMFVYDKIKDVEVKEAFLDICTFFHGWEWNLVVDIVDFSKLEDLHRRMLVSKSSSGMVIVHDILRLMGMNRANLTRFSNYKKLSDALEDNLDGFDMKDVKGISLLNNNHWIDNDLITIQSTKLEAMRKSLRVLMLGYWVTLEGPPCQKAFINLRYLRVGDIATFPFKDPFKLDKLRVFLNRFKDGMNLSHLPSSLRRIYDEVSHVGCEEYSLKCLTGETPKSMQLHEDLHLPASLVYLNLEKSHNLPKDIGHLTALESLILDRSNLECLPQGFGKLKKLKHLSMNYCSRLALPPEQVGMISSLETLRMNGCGNLRALPNSFEGLLSLHTLEFSACINLRELPESLGGLRIHSLNLHSLVNLKELPNSFGNMLLLEELRLESWHSLLSLPKSFVQLKLLKTLKIIDCSKLRLLPEDFGRLRCLERLTIERCHLLKELPHGFGALPALKTLKLEYCNNFVNFPRDFAELTSLEYLSLYGLPLVSKIPDGFGKLKKFRFLDVGFCAQLKTLSDDFENMAMLERIRITRCSELDVSTIEKIVKLHNCYEAGIYGSRKLLEKWEHMQGETEHPIVVLSGEHERDREEKRRAARAALLHWKCMEVKNGCDQLVERSSLFAGLEDGTTATLALIMLPTQIQSDEHWTLQGIVEMVKERAASYGWGPLQIVCARKDYFWAERPTEEEERAEEEGIRQILLSLPKRSCAIPSSQSKRVNVLTVSCEEQGHLFSFFMANVGVDMKFTTSDVLFPSVASKAEKKHHNSIENFIRSICPEDDGRGADEQSQSECVAGESKTTEFVEALKGKGIHYLLNDYNTRQMLVDDLHGKAIGFIVCGFKFLKCIKLQQIYKHLQQKDSDFIWIWIPTVLSKDCGHGTYARLIRCMPWATFSHPQLVNVESRKACFILLDKQGQIANHDALPLLLAWGVESYPFTQNTIPESFSLVESDSCLEFLLHGMNIVGRMPMRGKMIFLLVARPHGWLKRKSKLEELTQMHGNFEVLYVGKLFPCQREISYNVETLKQDYEDAIQNMHWASLSFSDMITFWYRCKYLANEEDYQSFKESSIMMEALHVLAKHLYCNPRQLLLVDNNGAVTCGGFHLVEMICEPSEEEGGVMRMVKDELMKSLSRGECTPLVRSFFRDEIENLPQHPQHPISYLR